MRHAAARALAALAVGIAAGQFLRTLWWIALAAVAVGVLAAFFTRSMTLYLALAGAGALLGPLRISTAAVEADYESMGFRGVVVEEPLGFRQDRMVVRLSGPGWGKVSLWLEESLPQVRYGDEVEVTARVSPFSFPRNPGMADLNVLLRQRGYVGEAAVRPGQVRVVGHGHGSLLMRLAVMPVRRYVHRVAGELVPGRAGALLTALLLGERRGLPEELQTSFVEGGVVHVLVVSGLHVGVIVAGVWLLLAVLGVRGWPGFGLTAAATGFYVLLVGASAAPVRAGLMAGAALFSVPTQRRASPLAGLCSAGIAVLLIDPDALFNVGAQLSFAATLAIVVSLSFLERKWQVRRFTPACLKWLLVPLAVSTAATIGTAPLLLCHFGRMQPLAPLSSLLVVPLVSLNLLAAILVVVVNIVWPALAGIMANSLGLMLNGLLLIVDGLGRLKVTMWEPGVIGWPVVFWLYGLGLLGLGWRMRWTRIALGVALGIGLAVFAWRPVLTKPQTQVTFLDTGRGDAVLLEDTMGRRLLVDAGIDGTGVLRGFLRMRGIHRLDAVIVSHPDRDHYGGLLELGHNVRVERLLVPTLKGEDTLYESLLRRLEQRGTQVLTTGAGARLKGFGFDVEFTAPGSVTRSLYEQGLVSTNLVSLVARVGHGDLTMLFTGDMDAPENLTGEPVWLVKSPHHGSRKGNPPELYRVLQPEYVVTMGRFPTRAGLEGWLASLGAVDINTRRDGGVVLRFGSSGPVFSHR